MSVYFVYRSHYDNPAAFHVKVFPQDTVLEWFQSIWVGTPYSMFAPFVEYERVLELFGKPVFGFDRLFTRIHQDGWPPPNTMTAAVGHLTDALALPTGNLRFDQSHVQWLENDLEMDLDLAAYIFDDHYAKKNPHRAAFLAREDWMLPDGAAEGDFTLASATATAPLILGSGTTYFAHFASWNSRSLLELHDTRLCGAVAGVRVADFPRCLFALRNRIAEHPTDESSHPELRLLTTGLDSVIRTATGDEAAFLAALTANPNDYAGWCAYSDWRMERDLTPLLSDVLRLYSEPRPLFQRGSGRLHETRDSAKHTVLAQTHVAQASKHVARWGNTDLYHHFILFDDLWANAHPDLAASILRVASRWDPL